MCNAPVKIARFYIEDQIYIVYLLNILMTVKFGNANKNSLYMHIPLNAKHVARPRRLILNKFQSPYLCCT